MTLIGPDNIFVLGGILLGLAWMGFWIDGNWLGRKTSGVPWVLTTGLILSNFRIIPFSAPTFDFVGGYMVPLAIPLLLYKSDLRKIFRESGKLMITFLIASTATVIGAVLGFFLLDLGEIGPKVAGTYAGAWIGGAVNFVAVSQAVEMTPSQFSVSLSASSIVSILALMMLVTIPSIALVRRFVPSAIMDALDTEEVAAVQQRERPAIYLTHISGGLALSFAICALAAWVSGMLSMSSYNILFITTITIIIANIFPRILSGLKGDFEMGMLFMYIFFAAIGAGTDAMAFIESALILAFYGLFIVAIHLVVVLAVARLLKVDLAEAVVASGAALVGPAVTTAIAAARGWHSLVTPAIMCGIFGYVIANFIGVTVTALLQ